MKKTITIVYLIIFTLALSACNSPLDVKKYENHTWVFKDDEIHQLYTASVHFSDTNKGYLDYTIKDTKNNVVLQNLQKVPFTLQKNRASFMASSKKETIVFYKDHIEISTKEDIVSLH